MKALFLISAAAAAWLASSAQAQAPSGMAVLKAKGCLGCHDMRKAKVGPAFTEVASKYEGIADAEKQLLAKLKEGKGHMKASATDAELRAALKEILAAQ